jgi:hypothetical protein
MTTPRHRPALFGRVRVADTAQPRPYPAAITPVKHARPEQARRTAALTERLYRKEGLKRQLRESGSLAEISLVCVVGAGRGWRSKRLIREQTSEHGINQGQSHRRPAEAGAARQLVAHYREFRIPRRYRKCGGQLTKIPDRSVPDLRKDQITNSDRDTEADPAHGRPLVPARGTSSRRSSCGSTSSNALSFVEELEYTPAPDVRQQFLRPPRRRNRNEGSHQRPQVYTRLQEDLRAEVRPAGDDLDTTAGRGSSRNA